MSKPTHTEHPMNMLAYTLLLAAVIVGPTNLFAKGKPYNDAYSMKVQALKGPEMTDVYATFTTADATNYPIPAALKKLQVKIKDSDDEVVFIINKNSVDVVDGVATMAVGDPGPHRMLYVLSLIKTSTRTVVLRDEALVLFRPDLVIRNLSAPDRVKVDELFDIEMIIQEVNHDIGATATVSLFDGDEQLVSMPDIYVPAGEQAMVVITSLGLATVGTHSLTVVISDADPAEYDDTNNTYSFSLEVIEDGINQQSSFSLAYENYTDYYKSYSSSNSCFISFSSGKNGHWDLLTLSADSYGEVPEGVIDEVWWQVETEAGIQLEKSETAVTPVNISETVVSYHIYDPDQNVIVDINVYPLDGHVQYTFRQQTGYYFSYSWLWGSYYYYTDPGDYVDAQDFITLRLLIQDENLRIGGEATALLSSTYVNEYDSDSGTSGGGLWGGAICYWSWSETIRYTLIEGDAAGTLDPVVLGKSIRLAQSSDAVLPATISLDGNYPNPFNPSTTLQFSLPEDQLVSLMVYDLLGREVAILVNGYVVAGTHRVRWNGKTATGADIPTGIYIARMTAGDYSRAIKLVYMK